MANPKIEDGFTQIANEILAALSKVNLSAYETRVVWFILRKTYGYHKKTDQIALSQIAEETGLDRGNAGRALRSLKNRHIVTVDGNEIGIQKDYDLWLAVSRTTPPVSPKTLCLLRPQKRVSTDTKAVSPETPQKKEIQRKNKLYAGEQKSPAVRDFRIKEFIDFFATGYRERFGQPYHVNGGKDGQTIKRLLGTFDLDELKQRATRLWNSDDPFLARTDRGIGILANQINKLSGPVLQHPPPMTNPPPRDLRYAAGE